MSTFRIRAEFDVEITDEAGAHSIAEQHWNGRIDQDLRQGGTLDTGGKTREEPMTNLLSNPLAVSSTVVTEMLGRGAQQMPVANFSNFNISHVTD
jgi:hypothetical protein